VKRKFRLTRSTDFRRVRRSGKSFAHPLFVLQLLPNSEESLRIGVLATRSVGGAVQRNRARRRMRACVDEFIPALPSGWDVVFIARAPLLEADFQQIRAAMKMLVVRAGLLQNEGKSGV